jgi:hypothetical protein
MSVEFGDRLNVITGDNGLGKSFLLEVAWWALTQTWVGRPALPNEGAARHAKVGYRIDTGAEFESGFEPRRGEWDRRPSGTPSPGVVLFARVDGSFAVVDPKRNSFGLTWDDIGRDRFQPPAFLFDPAQVWSGLTGDDGATYCSGLIADWRVWQLENSTEFEALKATLAALSPHPDDRLEPGPPRRIDLLDSRPIPTLQMPYGDVPVTHASAGARRILSFAYLLVWAWHEHRAAAELLGEPPSSSVTVLIDEVESHLHPRWQRVILPAVLDAVAALGGPADTQVLCVTHSPLVLASLEAHWRSEDDRLFTIDLRSDDGARPHVALRQLEWRKRGDVNAWLTSEVFDLGQARSVEAEDVIERARQAMQKPGESVSDLGDLVKQLARHVPETDPLLARLDALASAEEPQDA